MYPASDNGAGYVMPVVRAEAYISLYAVNPYSALVNVALSYAVRSIWFTCSIPPVIVGAYAAAANVLWPELVGV